MLKIYLCTVEYELHKGGSVIHLSTWSDYVIRDEENAYSKTKEFGAYTEEAQQAYCHTCELTQTKKGIKAYYWTWDRSIYAEEWIAPDAKLVAHASYKETSCSMERLMKLPAPDVIAYLKQEGLNLLIPS